MFGNLITKIGMGVLRHVATGAGVWLVSRGYLDMSQEDAFLGSVLFLGGLAFSAANKIIAHRKAAQAAGTKGE